MLPFVIVKSSGYLETVQRGVADFPEEPMLRWYLEGLISLDQAGMSTLRVGPRQHVNAEATLRRQRREQR